MQTNICLLVFISDFTLLDLNRTGSFHKFPGSKLFCPNTAAVRKKGVGVGVGVRGMLGV